jgi:hypothetical protein
MENQLSTNLVSRAVDYGYNTNTNTNTNKICNTFGLKDVHESQLVEELKDNTNYIVITSVNKRGNFYNIKIKLYDMSNGFNLSNISETINELQYDLNNHENRSIYTHEIINGDFKQYILSKEDFGSEFGDTSQYSNANTLKFGSES